MNRLNKLINESIRYSLKEFINEDGKSNDPNELINQVSIDLDVYFDNEKQKLMRKMKFAESIKSEASDYNNTILNLGYEFSRIETDSSTGHYRIYYYIAGSENWNDDDMIENEQRIYEYFHNSDYGIDAGVGEEPNGEVYIILTIDFDILNEIDV